jgi:hypothetical protein
LDITFLAYENPIIFLPYCHFRSVCTIYWRVLEQCVSGAKRVPRVAYFFVCANTIAIPYTLRLNKNLIKIKLKNNTKYCRRHSPRLISNDWHYFRIIVVSLDTTFKIALAFTIHFAGGGGHFKNLPVCISRTVTLKRSWKNCEITYGIDGSLF